MFYQAKHSFNADYYKIETGENFNFPSHIHDSFEIITVTDGEIMVNVDDKQYEVKKNESILVFPNQIHSLTTLNFSKHVLIIFSKKLVKSFYRESNNLIPLSNKFIIPEYLLSGFYRICENEEEMLIIKGISYLLCGEFDKTAKYKVYDKKRENDIIYKIFDFVNMNYTEDCSLRKLAEKTRYDYVYLSKLFKKNIGISYNEYVNCQRISEAAYLLRDTDKSIIEISNSIGYGSLRSFNRNFKAVMNLTASEYRLKCKKKIPQNH